MAEDSADYHVAHLIKQANIALISFIGPDGAGKTTHRELINKYLCSNGVKTKLVRVRAPHTLAYLLWRLLIKLGRCRVESNHLGMKVHIPSLNGSLSKNIWALVEFVSILPHLLRIHLLIHRGYVLLADRYVIDSVATIAFFLNDKSFIHSIIARLLLRFLPRNTIIINLDADYETISKRRGYITEPRTFIDMQRYTYYSYESIFRYDVLFTENYSMQETHERVLNIIRKRCITLVNENCS